MNALPTLLTALGGAVAVDPAAPPEDAVRVVDAAALCERVDVLAHASAFGDPDEAAAARWLLWELGQALGIRPASIHDLYMARGRGETPTNFTVPAINVRAIAFDCARAAFRAVNARAVGAVIFEIARSEIGYTGQRPAEYIASLLAAAIKEGFSGPLFVQGDHFQISAGRYADDSLAELDAVKALTREAIQAGFYNIDIDTSTLVDLDQPTHAEQQRLNASLCAELTRCVRDASPNGITVSVGGEIGEVGGHNSTAEELDAFMAEYRAALADAGAGISKISIQTGTSHGGVVLPDGTLAQVAVDFECLASLSRLARERYHLAGAVQHGASTLPDAAFSKFKDAGACEVHLATNFQNMLFDRLPADLLAEIYAWLRQTKSAERKPDQTDEQFLYSTRKHALGAFKHRLWTMPERERAVIRDAWEAQFGLLFDHLGVGDTRTLAAMCDPGAMHRALADVAIDWSPGGVEAKGEDVSDLAD
ncbi:MAG: class II fructose-bisphosphate aldolase [Ardenticatenales bacterium]